MHRSVAHGFLTAFILPCLLLWLTATISGSLKVLKAKIHFATALSRVRSSLCLLGRGARRCLGLSSWCQSFCSSEMLQPSNQRIVRLLAGKGVSQDPSAATLNILLCVQAVGVQQLPTNPANNVSSLSTAPHSHHQEPFRLHAGKSVWSSHYACCSARPHTLKNVLKSLEIPTWA